MVGSQYFLLSNVLNMVMENDLKRWMKLCEANTHLPRKFWLNPKTGELDPCSDHARDVLSMGLPGTAEWEEHLSQYADDDEEYEDAVDQNQSGLLELAMKNGWVRGGIENVPFLHHPDKRLVRAAATILRDIYGQERIFIETGDFQGDLEGYNLDRFIKSGRFPSSFTP